MDTLFRKINLLLKAKINEVLGEDHALGGARRKRLDPENLGPDVDKDIAAFRKRINEALAYETTLVERVEKLHKEIAAADQEADKAVNEGKEEHARFVIERIERLKRQAAIAEADLDDHRLVTEELIRQVNVLDSTVADVRRKEEAAPTETEETPEESPSNVVDRISTSLSGVLRDTRQKIDELVNNPPAPIVGLETDKTGESYEDEVEKAAVEDDLAARRARLSKPDNKKD